MAQNLDIIVPIRENLKKGLVFDLRARLPIGITLGLIGYQHEALPLMQTLSHATRAFV